MKKIYLLSMVVAFFNLCAAPIRSFQELLPAMHRGDRFVIVVDFAGMGKPGMWMENFTPSSMRLVPPTTTSPWCIVTSHLHFSDHSGAPTYEYVKYTFNEDNSVVIRTTFYEPQSFKPVGTGHTVNCVIGKGIELHNSITGE